MLERAAAREKRPVAQKCVGIVCMCVDMCVDMCMDMHTDMCMDTYVGIVCRHFR